MFHWGLKEKKDDKKNKENHKEILKSRKVSEIDADKASEKLLKNEDN